MKTLYSGNPAIVPHPLHPGEHRFGYIVSSAIGKALITTVDWDRGEVMARFDGLTSSKVVLHSLQVRPALHLIDPAFIDLLARSCDPNVMLDMQSFEMVALKNISANSILAMDYAHTEDYLYRTFDCACGSPNCRGHVTGRKQALGA